MTTDLQAIWVYLAASPLLALTLTVLAYLGGSWLYRRSGSNRNRPLRAAFQGDI